MCIWLAKRLLDDCSENELYIGGGTGRGHQGHVPSLGKGLPFNAPPSNCLVWCAPPEKLLKLGCSEMASEAIFVLKFIFGLDATRIPGPSVFAAPLAMFRDR